MTAAAVDLEQDARAVLDPDVFVDGAPVEALDRLRRHAPVHPVDLPDRPRLWLVTRHSDVVLASRDPDTFSSRQGSTFLDLPVPAGSAMLPSLDPPRHTQVRSLISSGFTPRRVAALEDRLRAVAVAVVDAVVDAAADGAEVDAVTALSAEMSLQALAEVMGVPVADRHQLFAWSGAIGSLGVEDPDYAPTPDALVTAATQMYAYCGNLLAERRSQPPRDDVLSALLDAEVEGERLSDAQLNELFLLLAVAGNETTRNTLSHGLLALTEHPRQWELLRRDRAAVPGAVEEMLRWASPVLHFRRTVQRDVELGGRLVRRGEWVVLHYLAANRDPDVFAHPGEFDVRRHPNPHVCFGGGGPHFCLGAQLARLEMRVLLEELLDRAPGFRSTGAPTRLRSAFFHGIKRLPARIDRSA